MAEARRRAKTTRNSDPAGSEQLEQPETQGPPGAAPKAAAPLSLAHGVSSSRAVKKVLSGALDGGEQAAYQVRLAALNGTMLAVGAAVKFKRAVTGSPRQAALERSKSPSLPSSRRAIAQRHPGAGRNRQRQGARFPGAGRLERDFGLTDGAARPRRALRSGQYRRRSDRHRQRSKPISQRSATWPSFRLRRNVKARNSTVGAPLRVRRAEAQITASFYLSCSQRRRRERRR